MNRSWEDSPAGARAERNARGRSGCGLTRNLQVRRSVIGSQDASGCRGAHGRRTGRADVRARHLGAPVGSPGAVPIRRARGGPSGRRHHGTRGQAQRPRDRVLRAPVAAHPRRAARRARATRLPDPGRRRRFAAGRAQPLEPVGAAERAAARRQRLAHPRRARANLANDGVAVDGGLEGPAAAREGRLDRPRRAGVPRRARPRLRLDRHGRAVARLERHGQALRARAHEHAPRSRRCP